MPVLRFAATLVGFAVLLTSTLACSDNPAKEHNADEPSPALGRGPWTSDEVTIFLRPAYDAMARRLGPLAAFTCASGGLAGYAPSSTPEDRIFQCTVVFIGGRAGARIVTFDERGAVAREIDLPSEYSVNPDIACTTEPEIEEELIDCADVPVEIDTRPLPHADRSLYGSRLKPASDRGETPIGEPERPADCGELEGESVTVVRHQCSEARRLNTAVREDPGCKLPRKGAEHRCTVQGYVCEMSPIGEEYEPWRITCSMHPAGPDHDDADYVRFALPPSP